jgi:hypothetical protein
MYFDYGCDYGFSYWRAKPTERDFSLDIVSRHPDFNGRTLKKYALEGIDSVGVWGDEKFELHFHNKSQEDVQVRISLDGTDILTGKPANLEINHDMWIVRAGRTLHLKAWAETSNGGASFVFTGADKSVSLHTHGDMSHKGIISAAVFTERDRPVRVYNARRRLQAKGITAAGAPAAAFNNSFARGETSVCDAGMNIDYERATLGDLKKEAAVGAGEYVEQKTRTVKGLDHPVLNSIIRVRYLWWDSLKEKLAAHKATDFPTGFPGEKIRTFADLSNVPRVASEAAKRVGIYADTPPSPPVQYQYYDPTKTETFDRFC